ncbi:MAG: SCO family protein [Pseudomonadota bacterium]
MGIFRIVLWSLVVLAGLGLGYLLVLQREDDDSSFAERNAKSEAEARAAIGGPFELVTHTGEPVTEESFEGRYRLMYFGYTYCPDVCPTDLSYMASTLDRLGESAPSVAAAIDPLFVTVDPERDTQAVMADHVARLHPRLVGLRGTPAQTKSILKSYRVYAQKAPYDGEGDPAVDYLVNHSAYIYLFGPDGKLITFFDHATPPSEMVAALMEKVKPGQAGT